MKKNPYDQALASLKEILTHDRISNSHIFYDQKTPKDKDDRGYWYSKSYPVFLKRFTETRSNNHDLSAWVERTAYVFSWIPRIPVVRLDENSIRALAELEGIFQSCRLWEIGTESYLGGLNDPINGIHHGERIFGTGFGRPPLLIKELIQLANSVLNFGENRLNLPTTTKLLHFMFPELLPIFDKNVCKALYGNSLVEDYYKYHAYIFSLQDYLENEPEAQVIFDIARSTKMPVLRIVDQLLFQQGINEFKD
ncbi:hypothetical protein BK138_32225 [Paenibacillus rhizosphaerae]|uniref:Uncharacterized protein n=1 Tax=Paenibacillus rhizosphaerae TaxID=297318 RepID=A0A1R1E654_9BACL|nr:hypothetical protein [Paenibacillus rhizosphaerae]OMF47304.1 hypothetical protein BK138_32225 [Paenibacillus rhizosphaerae]